MNIDKIQNETLLATSTSISKVQAAYSKYGETESFYNAANEEQWNILSIYGDILTDYVNPYKEKMVAEAEQTQLILNSRRNVISPQDLANQARIAKNKLAEGDSICQTLITIAILSYYGVIDTILNCDTHTNILSETLYTDIKKNLSLLASNANKLQPEYIKQYNTLFQKTDQRLIDISKKKEEVTRDNYWKDHKEEKKEYDDLITENNTISESINEANKELEVLRKKRDEKQPAEQEKDEYIKQLGNLELQLSTTRFFQQKKKRQLTTEINLLKQKLESISSIAENESAQHIQKYDILIKEAKEKVNSLTKRKAQIQSRFNEINNNIKKNQ